MAVTSTTKKLNFGNSIAPGSAPYTPSPLTPVKPPLPGVINNASVPGQAPLGGPSSSPLQSILDMIGSKGGQTLIGAAGAGLQAYGAGQQHQQDAAQNAHQFDANMAQRQDETDTAQRQSAATSAAQLSPLGQDQGFAQRQAIMKAILGGARNVSYSPGDPAVAAAMGSHSGGLTLPPGGLDPAMLERLYGDAATQGSIAGHAKAVGQINPNAPAPDFQGLFGGSSDGSENAFLTDVKTSNANALQAQEAAHARQREIINRAIDEDLTGAKQPKTSKKAKATSAIGEAGKYAAMGSVLGPWGTAGGAIFGGLKGLFS